MNPLCPFCKCELQTMSVTDLSTGWVTCIYLDCCNPECPREEMDPPELQQAWDNWMEESNDH